MVFSWAPSNYPPLLSPQLLSSGVIEALPDALARAEAQLPAAQRPLSLDWTRFLGVMGLCLEGAYRGAGTVLPSAVVRLFEETHDDKLDFLTRKRSRLPPSQKAPEAKGHHHHGLNPHGGAGGVGGSIAGGEGFVSRRAETASPAAGGAWTTATGLSAGGTTNAGGGGGGGGGVESTAEELSVREGAGGSTDTGDDAFEISVTTAAGGSISPQREEMLATTTRLGGTGPRRTGARGGGSAALKSLLRPQARHEVFRGYGQAMSRRRGRQREALRRAPGPDLEPTRAYKPCGLCQAPFPVESLGATVSLKVLGTFLAKAGAPSERFERKASRLCALHRLALCVFCSQFFNPDFPGGIVPPGGYTAKRCSSRGGGNNVNGGGRRGNEKNQTSAPTAAANGLVPFFDDRFPDRWSNTPSPSSAPASALSGTMSAVMGEEVFPALSVSPAKRGGCGGGGLGGAEMRVREAKQLREVGGLVLGGCSIRDRLTIADTMCGANSS